MALVLETVGGVAKVTSSESTIRTAPANAVQTSGGMTLLTDIRPLRVALNELGGALALVGGVVEDLGDLYSSIVFYELRRSINRHVVPWVRPKMPVRTGRLKRSLAGALTQERGLHLRAAWYWHLINRDTSKLTPEQIFFNELARRWRRIMADSMDTAAKAVSI